jgi:hypothetical protein
MWLVECEGLLWVRVSEAQHEAPWTLIFCCCYVPCVCWMPLILCTEILFCVYFVASCLLLSSLASLDKYGNYVRTSGPSDERE